VQYAAETALVAQRIEHLTTDQKVGGSSPSERATYPQIRGHSPRRESWPRRVYGVVSLTTSRSCWAILRMRDPPPTAAVIKWRGSSATGVACPSQERS
jgi:hypothetical protein